MKTLALNDDWDIYIDDSGNIATKEKNERLAQDVASSVMVWKGECAFDVERGIEFNKMEEHRNTIETEINNQALLVDGVADSYVEMTNFENRTLTPVIHVTNEENETFTIGE